jgi:hypothetical protein
LVCTCLCDNNGAFNWHATHVREIKNSSLNEFEIFQILFLRPTYEQYEEFKRNDSIYFQNPNTFILEAFEFVQLKNLIYYWILGLALKLQTNLLNWRKMMIWSKMIGNINSNRCCRLDLKETSLIWLKVNDAINENLDQLYKDIFIWR